MMKPKWMLTTAAAVLSMALPGMAQTPAKTAEPAKSSTMTKTTAKTPAKTNAPTAEEIADAKAKGLVWVNTSSKVYHKEGEYYGKTKKGKFMTEDEAKKGGFKPAQEPVAAKNKSAVKK